MLAEDRLEYCICMFDLISWLNVNIIHWRFPSVLLYIDIVNLTSTRTKDNI